jgi:hypothetical protein
MSQLTTEKKLQLDKFYRNIELPVCPKCQNNKYVVYVEFYGGFSKEEVDETLKQYVKEGGNIMIKMGNYKDVANGWCTKCNRYFYNDYGCSFMN